LFSSAPASASAASGASGDENATQLQLKLLGTIPGEKSIAMADIQDLQNKMESLFHIGDTVQGATVEEIARDRVVLLVNGRREVLDMTVNSSPAESPAAEPPKPVTPGPAPAVHGPAKTLSPTDIVINKSKLLSRLGSIEGVLKTVKLEPYVVEGKTEGMKITGLSDDVASMAALVNLQNGDVIQNVNGQQLNSQQKTFQVLQKARSQPSLSLQILRGDTVIPLNYSLSGSDQ
jgi:general secretion pathway protein C